MAAVNSLYQKLRYRAYRKGFRDGHKYGWQRMQDPNTPVKDYFNPPFWFDEWYAFGFDSGAKLEIE